MRTWIESIQNGTTIYLVYALILLIPSIIIPMLVTKKINAAKFCLHQLFAFYMSCLFALVFLPLPTSGSIGAFTIRLNLIPFHFVADLIREKSIMVILQVIFNIVMTIPFGMYLRYAFKLSEKKIILFTLALTLFIEIGQLTGLFFIYNGSYRVCDIEDVITNTLGGFLGCLLVNKFGFILPDLNKFDIQLNHRLVAVH